MQKAIQQLRLNIKSVKDLDAIYSLISENFPLLEGQADEILRAEIVLVVSALDCFIHDIVRQGMLETYQNERTASPLFKQFKIPFKALQLIESVDTEGNKLEFLEAAIQEANAKDSYQSPVSIEYALQLINIKSIWKNCAEAMDMSAKDIKDELALIINRRNKIAHEADYNNLTGCKSPINREQTNKIIKFIEDFCESIYRVVQQTKNLE